MSYAEHLRELTEINRTKGPKNARDLINFLREMAANAAKSSLSELYTVSPVKINKEEAAEIIEYFSKNKISIVCSKINGEHYFELKW